LTHDTRFGATRYLFAWLRTSVTAPWLYLIALLLTGSWTKVAAI
jgi:hypothetical protein